MSTAYSFDAFRVRFLRWGECASAAENRVSAACCLSRRKIMGEL